MKSIQVGELTFAVHDEGKGTPVVLHDEGKGTPVVLLHGWPDSHKFRRHQVKARVDAGHRVIAPDLRGFGESSKPLGVEEYNILTLVGDVFAILDSLGMQKTHVVGHDWGAALAWAIGAFVPDRVDRLVALSVGHPMSFQNVGFAQREKSWYMLLFQFEDIAEQWLSADDFANMRAWSKHPPTPRRPHASVGPRRRSRTDHRSVEDALSCKDESTLTEKETLQRWTDR